MSQPANQTNEKRQQVKIVMSFVKTCAILIVLSICGFAECSPFSASQTEQQQQQQQPGRATLLSVEVVGEMAHVWKGFFKSIHDLMELLSPEPARLRTPARN